MHPSGATRRHGWMAGVRTDYPRADAARLAVCRHGGVHQRCAPSVPDGRQGRTAAHSTRRNRDEQPRGRVRKGLEHERRPRRLGDGDRLWLARGSVLHRERPRLGEDGGGSRPGRSLRRD